MSFFFNGFPGFGGEGHGHGGRGGPAKEVENKKYYEILGVDKKANADEIRKAYRKKAVKLHPDKGGDQAQFQELQHAYEILSDENKRNVYDQYGEEGLKEGAGGGESDIFDLLMNRGRGGQTQKRKTKTVLHQLKVSIEDVYLGKNKYLEISRYRICTPCKGNGSKDPTANTKCSGCNGRGQKTVVRQISMGMIQQTVQCPDCDGEGQVIKPKDRCLTCKGQKVVQEKKTLEVHVEKGAPDGKRYTFAGESDQVPDCDAGDVVVEIQVEPHKLFIRKGADIIYKAEITLIEALTGFNLEITHLDGRKIQINSKPGEIIKPNQLKTVKELGLPFFESPFRFGNLYIQFEIVFPDKLDESQQKNLKDVFHEQYKSVKTISSKIEEQYTMNDFKKEDENTHHMGGKKEHRRGEEDEEEDDEMSGGARKMQCANQ